MKKHLFYPTVLLIILLLVFALGACTNAGEGSDNVTDTAISVDSMTRHNNFAPATTDSNNVDTLNKADTSKH